MKKKVVILGGGVSGRAALALAEKLGMEAVILSDAEDSALPECDLIVTSPGMHPLKSRLYAEALRSGTEFISEMEFGFRHFRGKTVAITGTNGKTTTTELTTALLRALGFDARPAGNIGFPLSEIAAAEHDAKTIAVVEVSSFQLERTFTFAPAAAALLNLASDHEDRYRGGFAEYCAVKRGIFDRVKPESRIHGLSFSGEPHRAAIVGETLCFDGKELLKPTETALNAPHNRENLAAATELVYQVAGERIFSETFRNAVGQFQPGAHRIELFLTADGIRFIDDSKGTNPAAVAAAVNATPGKIVLLLGGLDKGMDLTPLKELTPKLRGAVVFGACRERLMELLADAIPCKNCGTDFEKAVEEAIRMARNGDAVMLSPACASMDMFLNYAERGDRFQREVRYFFR